MDEGQKDDGEKIRMDLLPLDVLEDVAKVLTFGAKKYSDDNWKRVPDGAQRYKAALLRHLAAHDRGERTDPESGFSHMAHAATNALFMVWFYNKGENDGVTK